MIIPIQLWVILVICLSWTFGFPVEGPSTVSVVKDERISSGPNGTYSYEIVLTDGTTFKQSASTDTEASGKADAESPSLVIKGEYTFVDPVGMTHQVKYVADKNGFQPEGEDIPKVQFGSPTKVKSAKMETKLEEPLKTISSSLFSSPSA